MVSNVLASLQRVQDGARHDAAHIVPEARKHVPNAETTDDLGLHAAVSGATGEAVKFFDFSFGDLDVPFIHAMHWIDHCHINGVWSTCSLRILIGLRLPEATPYNVAP